MPIGRLATEADLDAWLRERLAPLESVVRQLQGPGRYMGTGSPEGVITAPVGAEYRRLDGGTGTTLYVKESGTGNTGWAAHS